MNDKNRPLIKKKFGQHFLRDIRYVISMLNAVKLTDETSVFEIGCGDGFLTRQIMQAPIARLWVFEIDPEWAQVVQEEIIDPRLTMFNENFLDIDLKTRLYDHAPWTILANLPYNVTFPILERFYAIRHMITEGVIMVQEEVGQKICKSRGKGFGYISLFFQWYFEWRMLDKVPPSAFEPPPKVFSRLLHFKPRLDLPEIPDEQEFWLFIKRCFKQPRRTLRNNLQQSHFDISALSDDMLALRAQQLEMHDLLEIWDIIRLR